MLRIYKSRQNYPNIFSAFEYMDYREDYLRYYKAMMAQMQNNYYNNYMQYMMSLSSENTKMDSENHNFQYNVFPYDNSQQSKMKNFIFY